MFLKLVKTISIVLYILLILNTKGIQSEIFSATDDVTELFEVERVILTKLSDYLKKEKERIDILEKKILEYQKEHKEVSDIGSQYLQYPINAFLILKRLTIDLSSTLQNFVSDTNFLETIQNESGKKLNLPSNEDLFGSIIGLARLQQLYNLNVYEIADGYFNNERRSPILNGDDCYLIGYLIYQNLWHEYAIPWLILANERLEDASELDKIGLFEKLADSYNQTGKYNKALQWSKKLIQIDPTNEIALNIKNYISKINATKAINNTIESIDLMKYKEKLAKFPNENNIEAKQEHTIILNQFYKKLCRNELQFTVAALRCRYVTNNIPFLKIAPFKVEEKFLDPYIVTFHDILSDAEIEMLKSLSKPKLNRAGVKYFDNKTNQTNYHGRIGKSAWLKDTEHEMIKVISQRVHDMTGLSSQFTEDFQILNYGIGGHYEPHVDFSPPDYPDFLNSGNRIATMLLYMSDVEIGGATVFPVLNVALWPQKGSAAFWYNLHRSGESDFRTLHAGCPVLVGNKWVANKWFHSINQEFTRPCGLKPDHK